MDEMDGMGWDEVFPMNDESTNEVSIFPKFFPVFLLVLLNSLMRILMRSFLEKFYQLQLYRKTIMKTTFSHLLQSDKRVRFVQANNTSSLLEASVPSTSTTLNALDLDSSLAAAATSSSSNHENRRGEELQQFYQQIVSSSSIAATPGDNAYGRDDEIEVLEVNMMESSDQNDHRREAIAGDDDEIIVLHETHSSPNLHTSSSHCCSSTDAFARQKQQTQPTTMFSDREVRLFLKAAAENDLQVVAHYCRQGMDIEVQDIFRWTALMCSAAVGAEQVVRFLLTEGANSEHQDYAGRTAAELAQRCGHPDTKRVIDNFRRDQEASWLSDSLQQKCELNRLFCSACRCYYSDGQEGQAQHERSMVHLISTGMLPQEGYAYAIPSRSPGYKLLKSYGWTEAKGLGKAGQGRKYPIKTVLKRDTKGLGLNSGSGVNKAERLMKVTHFGPMDTRAVDTVKRDQQRPLTLAKQRALARQKEAQLRRMFQQEDGDEPE